MVIDGTLGKDSARPTAECTQTSCLHCCARYLPAVILSRYARPPYPAHFASSSSSLSWSSRCPRLQIELAAVMYYCCLRECLWTLCAVAVVYGAGVDAASTSGVYADNGVQTVRRDPMSADEWNEVEREVTAMFGVPRTPRKSAKRLDGSASRFLFDVYKSLQQDGRTTRSTSDVGQYDDRTVQDSDVIVTLYQSTRSAKGTIRHEHSKRIWFELNHVPPKKTHTITLSEVYIYKLGNFNQDIRTYSINLYQVLNTKNRDKELKLVSTQNTTSDFDGWLRFNTTTALLSWTCFSFPNRGLYISVHLLDNKDHEIKPEDIGMITWTNKHQLSESKKPFMAVYLKSKNGGNIVTDPSLRKHRRKRQKLLETSSLNFHVNPFQDFTSLYEVRSCQVQTLYVSFRDLEWQDWIIAPDGYGAYYCSGSCNFPLNSHLNATNHAIVQTLIHLLKPLRIPKPCCAPTKMAQQSILFFLDDNNVILKKYRNMVVKSCGCH